MQVMSEVEAARMRGGHAFSRGLFVAARDEFQRWLELVEPTAEPSGIIAPLNALAAVAHRRGEIEQALLHLRRAMAWAQLEGSAESDQVRVRLNLMMMLAESAALDEAMEVARETSLLTMSPHMRQIFWLNLSMLHWRRQEWDLMQTAAESAFELGRVIGDEVAAAKAQVNLGIAYLELGRYDEATPWLQTALIQTEQDDSESAYILAEIGRMHFLQGDLEKAVEFGSRAMDALMTGEGELDREEVARVSRLFGSIFAQTGQRNLALKYLNRAAAYFSQLGFRAEWHRCTTLIGQVLSQPVAPARRDLLGTAHRLDFLTAMLDLIDDLESVDPYLRGHSERVASLVTLIGEAAGLGTEDLKILKHAGRLHDVGMVAVEFDLIHREGPLSQNERRRVALHSTIGEEMLRPYGLDARGLAAIRHHHEHWDGSGSPDGLQGEEIPLMARCVALSDIYDALTSERVYRRAMCHADAITELQGMAGKELDPNLVSLFVRLHEA